MVKKKSAQLPSGNFRVQVYLYTDENGKKVRKSFTGKTKKEAEYEGWKWRIQHGYDKKSLRNDMTVHEACDKYIILKENVLSPSTVRGYQMALKKIDGTFIAQTMLSDLDEELVQSFISVLSINSSPKTVSNVYGFFTASITLQRPKLSFNVTLPKDKRIETYIPTTEDIQKLLDACGTTELKLGILFAALGTMRRGEACAITFDDVNYKEHTIRINKAFVETPDYTWELKSPKTYESARTIVLPEYVFDMIRSLNKDEGYIVNAKPDRLYVRFKTALKKAGLPNFRYHDLRHYAASQMHADGVPDRYIEAMGGWKPGSTVLKRVYENVMTNELKEIQKTYMQDKVFAV
jgi:integrase